MPLGDRAEVDRGAGIGQTHGVRGAIQLDPLPADAGVVVLAELGAVVEASGAHQGGHGGIEGAPRGAVHLEGAGE